MKQRQKYVAPAITVVTFRCERGYAASTQIFSAAQQLNELLEDQINQANAAGDDFAAGYFDNVDETNPTGSWVYDPNGGAGGTWF